jgi:hypothetical protein
MADEIATPVLRTTASGRAVRLKYETMHYPRSRPRARRRPSVPPGSFRLHDIDAAPGPDVCNVHDRAEKRVNGGSWNGC